MPPAGLVGRWSSVGRVGPGSPHFQWALGEAGAASQGPHLRVSTAPVAPGAARATRQIGKDKLAGRFPPQAWDPTWGHEGGRDEAGSPRRASSTRSVRVATALDVGPQAGLPRTCGVGPGRPWEALSSPCAWTVGCSLLSRGRHPGHRNPA